MPQNIVIVSGGCLENLDYFRKKTEPTDNCLLICCDGGARHLAAAGIIPDVLAGDMDSISPAQLADYECQGVKILKYATDKDFTDTALALDYALGLKPSKIDIWGALGGRLDHTLANVHLLIRGREAGIDTRLIDAYSEVFVAGAETIFTGAAGCPVSLVALGAAVEGLSLSGFQYPLNDETLSIAESRGISNVIVAKRAVISVRSGHLLVIRYWQKEVFPEVR